MAHRHGGPTGEEVIQNRCEVSQIGGELSQNGGENSQKATATRTGIPIRSGTIGMANSRPLIVQELQAARVTLSVAIMAVILAVMAIIVTKKGM
jgi:hypothetical protein